MNSGQPRLARFPDNTVQHVPRPSAKGGASRGDRKSPGPSITLAARSAIPRPVGLANFASPVDRGTRPGSNVR